MIELKNLCAGYHGADVLRGVSMSFEPGRVTVLVGANGCGKSTLLKAAIGMIKRSSGEVYIDSRPLDTLTRREVALRAAYMPQDRSVPSISARRLALHGRFPHLSYPRRYSKADYAAAEEALRRVRLLRNSVKYKAVDVHWHDPATSFVEAVMSRAGREAAAWVEAAWRRGARFDAWTEHFDEEAWREAAAEAGIDPEAVAQTSYSTDRVMPWAHISTGVSTRFLARERRLAEQGRTTPDCTFGDCSACGACPSLGADNELARPRVANPSAPADSQEASHD